MGPKEGLYQDWPLLYPFHHFLSLPWSCFSPGSALSCPILHNSPQKIVKYGSFTESLIPCNNQLPTTIVQIQIIQTECFQGCLRFALTLNNSFQHASHLTVHTETRALGMYIELHR